MKVNSFKFFTIDPSNALFWGCIDVIIFNVYILHTYDIDDINL